MYGDSKSHPETEVAFPKGNLVSNHGLEPLVDCPCFNVTGNTHVNIGKHPYPDMDLFLCLFVDDLGIAGSWNCQNKGSEEKESR